VVHQAQVKAFVAAQNDLNAENASELDSFVEATASLRAASARTLQTWRLGRQQPLLDQAAVVSAVAPAEIIAALGTSQTQAAALSDDGSGAALDTVNTALKKLAARPNAREQFAELVEAYSSVSTALSSIQKSANTATPPPKGAAPSTK
jgi:hypothetical protein